MNNCQLSVEGGDLDYSNYYKPSNVSSFFCINFPQKSSSPNLYIILLTIAIVATLLQIKKKEEKEAALVIIFEYNG